MTPNEDGSIHEARENERTESVETCERTLTFIRKQSRPLTLSELAETIVDRRPEWLPSLDGIDAEEYVRIRLHHVDLPKLQKRGAIEYDRSLHLVL